MTNIMNIICFIVVIISLMYLAVINTKDFKGMCLNRGMSEDTYKKYWKYDTLIFCFLGLISLVLLF